ncbi:hypothetical protein [Shivajiella indica]|uniref:NodB homology domain-containing protein n=1 Tax=Shivajiella indica TaxID=872115 RepID=A0ABW5BD18_9BACT
MNLIITYDYELFGDGSGHIFKHIIEPTDKILQICEQHQIKTTLFFEVVEYWYIKKEWDKGNQMGYTQNPILAIENQLKKAYKNGHDIQLHFHPQWLGAEFKVGKWHLKMQNWRLGDFEPTDGIDTLNLFLKGIETIKQILKPLDSDYEPTIIRAGGYNIQPSTLVADAMLNTRLKIDSSVYPGGYENGALSRYDYRNVTHDKDYWIPDLNDFSKANRNLNTLKEIPIFSLNIPRWKKFTFERIKSILVNKDSAMKSVKAKTAQKSKIEKIKYWFEKEAVTWDFCLFSKNLNKYYIKFINKQLQGKRDTFILIGHPKNFTSPKSLSQLIKLAKKNGFEFITLQEYAKRISS